MITVIKRDGSRESWDKNKVLNSVANAGTSPEEAESIVNLVEVWATKFATNGEIKSEHIRAKVIELLQAIQPAAATSFETYNKTT